MLIKLSAPLLFFLLLLKIILRKLDLILCLLPDKETLLAISLHSNLVLRHLDRLINIELVDLNETRICVLLWALKI